MTKLPSWVRATKWYILTQIRQKLEFAMFLTHVWMFVRARLGIILSILRQTVLIHNSVTCLTYQNRSLCSFGDIFSKTRFLFHIWRNKINIGSVSHESKETLTKWILIHFFQIGGTSYIKLPFSQLSQHFLDGCYYYSILK